MENRVLELGKRGTGGSGVILLFFDVADRSDDTQIR